MIVQMQRDDDDDGNRIDEDDGAYRYHPNRHALDACFYAADRMHAYNTTAVRYTCVNLRGWPPTLPLPLPSQHPKNDVALKFHHYCMEESPAHCRHAANR